MGKVFLITGCSTCFSKNYVEKVLANGEIVVGTAHKLEQLEFTGTTEENFLSLRLDVTDKQSIHDAFEQTVKKFGRVDVVVNNAGYSLAGCFEELKEDQIRQ